MSSNWLGPAVAKLSNISSLSLRCFFSLSFSSFSAANLSNSLLLFSSFFIASNLSEFSCFFFFFFFRRAFLLCFLVACWLALTAAKPTWSNSPGRLWSPKKRHKRKNATAVPLTLVDLVGAMATWECSWHYAALVAGVCWLTFYIHMHAFAFLIFLWIWSVNTQCSGLFLQSNLDLYQTFRDLQLRTQLETHLAFSEPPGDNMDRDWAPCKNYWVPLESSHHQVNDTTKHVLVEKTASWLTSCQFGCVTIIGMIQSYWFRMAFPWPRHVFVHGFQP